MERRLAAILAADVVGYTKLMSADEEATLAQLRAHRAELFDPTIAKHNGRIIKLMGDGTLVEFASVVDAVSCAIAIQTALAKTGGEIQLRIGINLGDVIVDGDDIYGDGVNIAARLEALAETGDVLVSRTVADHVKGKIASGFQDLGERNLKNIPEPVQVFRVVLSDGAAAPHAANAGTARPSRSVFVAAGIAALIFVIGALVWQRPWQSREEPASAENMAFVLPDKPSIAVLPFANFSEDAKQAYFADGITEDLITDLSKISSLFVIARNSTFSYKGKQVKVRQVAEELGVRFVLEGSVRRAGNKVRINAQLIDATTGGHLWAERYDGTNEDVFKLQDKVTSKIVAALALSLTPQEVKSVGRAETSSAAAHDAYLLGLSHYHRRTPSDNATAKTHFEKAVQLDPNYSAAYIGLAKVYVRAMTSTPGYSEKLAFSFIDGTSKPWKYLQKARVEPGKDYFLIRSRLALLAHQQDRAVAEAERALSFNSNDSEAFETLAEALIFAGRPKAAIDYAHSAIRQNPTQLGRPHYLIGLAEFALGDSKSAIDSLKKAIGLSPDERYYLYVLAAAYGDLGQTAKAVEAFEQLEGKVAANWPLHKVTMHYPFSDAKVLERFAKGLKIAGLSVQTGGYLQLTTANRLNGSQIKSLLFGKQIKGTGFWSAEFKWWQRRQADGTVEHHGVYIQPGVTTGNTGTGRIEKDLLCQIWPNLAPNLEICVSIFRVTGRIARIKWGDYVMVTATGPHPFSVAD